MTPFETFEHTADVGLRISAASLDDLFAEAGSGFFSLIVEDPETIRPDQVVELSAEADRLEDLMLDWLNELLYCFETQQLLFCRFDVHVEGTRLRARCQGEPVDWDRHELHHEIKAITYHELQVEQRDGEWFASVIFDI